MANPALRALKRGILDANSHPLALWLSTELPDALGGFDALAVLTAEAEAECDRLIGALPCPHGVPHGWERTTTEPVGAVEGYADPCPSCGAAL